MKIGNLRTIEKNDEVATLKAMLCDASAPVVRAHRPRLAQAGVERDGIRSAWGCLFYRYRDI